MSSGPIVFGTYDQAGLDAQYNNRALVPDYARYFTRWREESLAVRARLEARLGLAYGADERERLDVFPAPGKDVPTLLFLHGGYWQALDRSDFSYPAASWVAAGVAFAAASYPLAPKATMDEIVDAAQRAALWVRGHARDWGGDPERVFCAGHSAGGHLVAMLMTAGDAGPGRGGSPVRGGIALSGLYDLEPIRLSYLNAGLGLDRDMARRNAPLERGQGAAGSLLLAVGAEESPEFLRQNQAMARLWRDRSLPLTEVAMPGLHHFSAVDALAEPAHPLFQAAFRLVTGADRGM